MTEEHNEPDSTITGEDNFFIYYRETKEKEAYRTCKACKTEVGLDFVSLNNHLLLCAGNTTSSNPFIKSSEDNK